MTLSVIGAGLGRTGTVSLKLALERLGFGPCFHMTELIADPSRVPLWLAAADGKPDWPAIFAGYRATTDYPACRFWRELADAFPAAKVILTVREPAKWFESVSATIFSPAMAARMGDSPLTTLFAKTTGKDFGDRIADRDFMIEAFERHTAEVERGIQPDRLLVYEVSRGWQPLCEFLGVPVPDEPFPKTNSRDDMAAFMARDEAATAADGPTGRPAGS